MHFFCGVDTFIFKLNTQRSMCGICGFSWDDANLLRKMAQAIGHRGPNHTGYHQEKSISLVIKRLSIIDLSSKGNQPMYNEDTSMCVAYNGEIYNFKEIRKDLQSKGHRFHSETDTEVIVHAYEEHGPRCVELFDGMFAFAIWDSKKNPCCWLEIDMG